MTGHAEGEKESLLTNPKRPPDSNQGRVHKLPRRTSSPNSSARGATLPDGGQASLQGFQFVQVDSSGRPQNADLKTAVRSNARRHTQKERQRPKAGAGPRPLAIKQIRPVQLRPHSQQAMQSDPELGGPPPMKDIDQKQGNDPSSSQSYKEILSSHLGTGRKASEEDHVAIENIIHERPPSNLLPPQNTFGLSGTFSLENRSNFQPKFDRWQNLSHEANTPYALTLGAGAPMLYMEATRWPFPFQLRGEEQPKVSFWMPESGTSIPDAGVPRGPLTKTISPVVWISRSFEFYTYKLQTIRWVSDRLAIPNEGTSDTTIGVIICLTMWEIARSDNLEAVQHMLGVEKIIKIRGGIDALSENLDFQLKILLVDLFTSIVSNTSPRLPNLNRKEPLEPPRKILGLDVNAILDSPLYRHRAQHRLDNVTVGPPFDQTSIRLLQIMRSLTLQPSIIVRTALLSEAASIFQTQEVNSNISPLFKTILHASLIYSRAFHVEPMHFSSPINHNSLEILVQELESEVNDEIWLRYPGVFLWVLLTATIAADGRPERAFLAELFGRIVPVAKWGWWNEVRASMLTFLDVKRMAEARISEVQ